MTRKPGDLPRRSFVLGRGVPVVRLRAGAICCPDLRIAFPPSHVPGCRRGVRVALDCQTRAQDLPTDQPMRASLVIAVLPPFLLLPWDRPASVRPADGTTAPPGVRHRRCRRAAGRPSPCRAWRGGPLARRSTMRTLFFNHATAALPCFMQPCQDAAIATQSQLHPVEGLNSCA